jgi:hypothetical protein
LDRTFIPTFIFYIFYVQGQFCGHGEHGQITHGAQMHGQFPGLGVVVGAVCVDD